MVTTMPPEVTAAEGRSAVRAPACRSAAIFSGVRLYAATSNPALSRFIAIGSPMLPMPTNATACAMSFLPQSQSAPQVVRDIGADDLLEVRVALEAQGLGPRRVPGARPGADDAFYRRIPLPMHSRRHFLPGDA